MDQIQNFSFDELLVVIWAACGSTQAPNIVGVVQIETVAGSSRVPDLCAARMMFRGPFKKNWPTDWPTSTLGCVWSVNFLPALAFTERKLPRRWLSFEKTTPGFECLAKTIKDPRCHFHYLMCFYIHLQGVGQPATTFPPQDRFGCLRRE